MFGEVPSAELSRKVSTLFVPPWFQVEFEDLFLGGIMSGRVSMENGLIEVEC